MEKEKKAKKLSSRSSSSFLLLCDLRESFDYEGISGRHGADNEEDFLLLLRVHPSIPLSL